MSSTTRLEEIIKNNDRRIQSGGMQGALEVMAGFLDPATCKRLAAENIIAHRNCVKANAKWGRTYRGNFWLSRAAAWRRRAYQMAKI